MSTLKYDFPSGNQPRCRLEFRENGTLTSPTVVVITVAAPDETTQTLDLTDLTAVSEGVFDLFVHLEHIGEYVIKVKATAPFLCATPLIILRSTE